jgi:hypothetical protein
MATIARAPLAILPNVGMSQSGLMISALLAGFVVYLAVKQRLGVYWSILIGGGGSSTTTPASTTTAPASTATSSTLPATQGSILGLGGTTSTATTAAGGVGTATPTGIAGLPNTSLDNFFGLQ